MKSTEYEKLCDEAFGKPEKRNVLKVHKRTVICVAAVLVVVLVMLIPLLLGETVVYSNEEIPKPIWLMIESRGDGVFMGSDINGKRWLVHGNPEGIYENSDRIWVSFKKEPKLSTERYGGWPMDYEVTATKCWWFLRSNKTKFGDAADICEFDIDRDGTVEQCILAMDSSLSFVTYTLYVWDGYICEKEVTFNPTCAYLAFYSEGKDLKLVGIDDIYVPGGDSKYIEVDYDIIYKNGKLGLMEDGNPLETR